MYHRDTCIANTRPRRPRKLTWDNNTAPTKHLLFESTGSPDSVAQFLPMCPGVGGAQEVHEDEQHPALRGSLRACDPDPPSSKCGL